jgi:NRPS condensation-like uncharacterized protein
MKAENFATTGQDWANYISHELDSNGMIYMTAVLNGQPDADFIKQAVMDSIELQPVLGCKFDVEQEPPVWMPIQENVHWFSVIQADTWQGGFASFLREEPGQEQLAVRLITCPSFSVLCIRLNHAVTDGAGAKGYLTLLCRLYNACAAGEKLQEKIPQDRSEKQVYAACGIKDFRMALRRDSSASVPFVVFPHQNADGQEVRYAWVTFPLQEVKVVDGCTVNDLLLAACARALTHEMDMEQSVALNMTVDLRRYLKEEDTPVVCNLSGMEKVYLAVSPGETFTETAGKVSKVTSSIKLNQPGLHSAASMNYLRMMPFGKAEAFLLDASRKAKTSGAAVPIVSNLGWLYRDEMKFGDMIVTDIIPLVLAMHAPAVMIGAGSYGDNLTLSAGYYEGERALEDVERFLHRVRDEMIGEER